MKTKEDIVKIIEEEDVEFIRLQFADAFGNIKNIAVTTGQMGRVMDNQYSFEGSALFDGMYPFEDELYLYPDLDTFVILPWRPQQRKVAKIICDVCYEDGRLFEMSPRTILKRMVALADAQGYKFLVAPECEFYLFHTDDNGTPTTISHEKAGYLDVGPFDFGENARRDIVLTLEDMGFDIESSCHELSPAQHEIDFSQGESLQTADDLMTFKLAVRSIAKRFGLYATFMPKPKMDSAGSGMHLNISMYHGSQNLFDENEEGVMVDEARFFIGGILAHAAGMCAITNPIVNSYKRFSSGFQAPSKINYDNKGETVLVKYRKRRGESKIELRFPDTSANPYLAIAVTIAAGLDGIANKINPDKVDVRHTKQLPANLDVAIKAMLKDDVVCKCLGKNFIEMYTQVKEQEWNDYMRQVSDWEIERYLTKM